MQYILPNVCLAAVVAVQYVLLYGLYEYVREVDLKCSALQQTVATNVRRARRDANIAENSVTSSNKAGAGDDGTGDAERVEFINPNLRPIVEKETDAAAAKVGQPNGTKEEWYWLNAYSRIPVSVFLLSTHAANMYTCTYVCKCIFRY